MASNFPLTDLYRTDTRQADTYATEAAPDSDEKHQSADDEHGCRVRDFHARAAGTVVVELIHIIVNLI
jgi:hypothetical protein